MANNTKSGYISKGQAVQLRRIEEDERMANQKEIIKNEIKANMNAMWVQSLEESSQNKMLKRKNNEIASELKLANKATAMVRRVQLKKLLTEEREQLERELNEIGLTFHKERL